MSWSSFNAFTIHSVEVGTMIADLNGVLPDVEITEDSVAMVHGRIYCTERMAERLIARLTDRKADGRTSA